MEDKNIIPDRLRMYSLNIYNCSPIQCGIQSAHSNMEYALEYWEDEDFQEWAKYHKTVVLLNGGVSNKGDYNPYGFPTSKGTMETHLDNLINNGIKAVPFYEPDMNNALTSISFLVDERVYNRKKYTDMYDPINDFDYEFDYIFNDFDFEFYLELKRNNDLPKRVKEWVDLIGGDKNLFLRFYLDPKKVKLSNN